jgi:outer membrane protein assembly factor BamA
VPLRRIDLGCQGAGVPIAAPGFLDADNGDCLARHHLIDTRIELKLDSRDPDREFKGGTGVLVEVFGGFTFSPAETSLNFVRYGGELAGFYDFTDLGHVVALRIHTELIVRTGTALRGTGDREIPFTELASLGGLDTMRGFLAGRFLGDSTLEATLSYRYPVWSILDAEIFTGVGNAFEGHYGIDEGIDGGTNARFSFERLYFNAGIGLRTTFARDSAIQILLAFGTNRFDGGDGDGGQGLELDSVRFVFGFVEGF